MPLYLSPSQRLAALPLLATTAHGLSVATVAESNRLARIECTNSEGGIFPTWRPQDIPAISANLATHALRQYQ
eukprot:6194132-Pleurochrysis_carterae.AAC.10